MALLLKGYHCKFWNTNRLSTSYTTSHRFIISYFSNQVRDFEIKAFIKSWFSHVIVLESLLLRSCLHCGHHACYRTLIFLHNIGNKRQCATSSSQRSLGNLHCYCATIRGSKLPLFQVYFAVSLLPFGASCQPKFISSYCCSYSQNVNLFLSGEGLI